MQKPALPHDLKVVYVPITHLKPAPYNPRVWSPEARAALTESIKRFGLVDPVIVNSASKRKNVMIGGHFRVEIAKELGITEVPVVYINIPDLEREKELCIRLNKNTGEFDWEALASFKETFLQDIGFNSEDLDRIFDLDDETPEEFDLQKELKKLDIKKVEIQKGDLFDLDGSRMLVGDSTVESDMLRLMGDHRADMCFTDPPYILDYLHGKKKNGKPVTGFGYKRDRRYLETDVLPDDFTEKWMGNVAKVQADNFSIIVYENWKNIRTIWNEMERHWKVKNMIVWHLSNRVQGFSAKNKFFNKHDIAMVGCAKDCDIPFNHEHEADGLQNEYETALYAISGKPHWEPYKKGNKHCPTDFIEFRASDEKHSGQGIIFGTKPTEILIPYIKVLDDVKKIMRDPSVTEVGFFGHGNSHAFCLTNGTMVFYCDYNDDRCAKKFVHQLHCGTREGKSLIDYVVPEANKASCYFFRKTVTGREIMKWLKQKTVEALAAPASTMPDPALRDKWMEMSIREISTQCKFATIAFDNLTRKGQRGTDRAFSSAHSFLSHAANVSKLLKAKDIASPFAGGVVGDELQIIESSPVHDRRLRNNLEHYDERLQKWIVEQGPKANIGTYNIGPKSAFSIGGLVYVTHYDPTTNVFTFVNEDFDLATLDSDIRKIQGAADDWVGKMEAMRRYGARN